MAEYTKEELEASHNIIELMGALLEKSMFRLTEGTTRYNMLCRRLQAFSIAQALMQRKLQGGHTDNSTKEELQEALEAIESEKQKLEATPAKMDCCIKTKTLLMCQDKALGVATELINEELGQMA